MYVLRSQSGTKDSCVFFTICDNVLMKSALLVHGVALTFAENEIH